MSEPNPYQAPSTEAPAQQGPLPLQGASLTAAMLEALKATRPWVRFFSVMGFIGMGFMILAGLSMGIIGVLSDSFGGFVPAIAIAGFYILLGAVYLVPTIHLHKFAGALGRVFSRGGVDSIEEALRRQASFWRASGILTIVGMGLGVLAVIGVAVFAALSAAGSGF